MTTDQGALHGGPPGPPFLFPLPRHRAYEVTGKDAGSYLHRMLTQDVRSIRPGHARPSFVLSREGRVLGDPVVWRLSDRWLLTLDAAAAAKAIPALERSVIADDVVMRDATDRFPATLVVESGSRVAPGPPDVLFPAPGDLAVGDDMYAVPLVLYPDPAWLWIGREGPRSGEVARPSLLDSLRIRSGVPWYGAEIDDRVLPTECGPLEALSWTKGCYPGQEPVVMSKHRGHPATRLCRLRMAEAPNARAGTSLLHDDRPAGRLTTVGGFWALGLVRHAEARADASFAVEGGGEAFVADVLV